MAPSAENRPSGSIKSGGIRLRTAIYLAVEILLFVGNIMLFSKYNDNRIRLAECQDEFDSLTSLHQEGRRPLFRIISKVS